MSMGLAHFLAGTGADKPARAAEPAAPQDLAAASRDPAASQDPGAATQDPGAGASSAAASAVADLVPLRILGTEVMGQLTGAASPNDTAARWDVYGADLGHMFVHRGKLHMVFGDTYGPGGFASKNWRSNVMARIADPDPRKGLPFEAMIEGPDGNAKELLPPPTVLGIEKTVIPTYGISIGGRMYLHYMSVRHWGPPGRWDVGHSGLAYSDDDGETWARPERAVWRTDIGFEQVAFVLDKGVLYTFGIPEGRYGGVRLRRVAPERILERDAYEYWDGEGWVPAAAAAATIVPAPVGELSVAWSAPHQRWLMMYLEPARRAVVLRTAPRLTGPWGEAQTVITAEAYPKLYGPYIVPGAEIGGHLYYTLSRWEAYNVFLMRTTLAPAAPAPAPALVSQSGEETPVAARE